MPETAEIANRLTFAGVSFVDSRSVSYDGPNRKTAVMAAAKIGQLTTRTDADTGTLTMASGHGITTGARLDLYWDGGCRRGITVGTVSGLSVPFDLGAGDNLPDNLTAITAQVPQEEELLVTGDSVQIIGAKSTRRGQLVFCEDDDTEVLAIEIEATNGGGYQWYTGNGITNPLASADVAKVYFSNGSSAGTNEMVAAVGSN